MLRCCTMAARGFAPDPSPLERLGKRAVFLPQRKCALILPNCKSCKCSEATATGSIDIVTQVNRPARICLEIQDHTFVSVKHTLWNTIWHDGNWNDLDGRARLSENNLAVFAAQLKHHATMQLEYPVKCPWTGNILQYLSNCSPNANKLHLKRDLSSIFKCCNSLHNRETSLRASMEKLSCSSPHSRHGGTTKLQKKCKIHQDATKSCSCDFLWKFTTLICSAAMQWSCGIFARAATFFGGDFLFSIKPTSCEYTSFLDAGPLVNLFFGRWKIKAASHW